MDYAGLAEAAAAKIGQYRQDPGGWRGCRSTSEVVVSWRPSAEFSGNVYRAEGTVAARPEDVWECIKPVAGGLRTKWDQNVKDFEVVEAVSDAVSVCRTTTPSAFMRIISPREFVDVVLMKQYEDGTMLSAGMICLQFIYVLECNFSAVKVPVPMWHGLLGSNLNDLSRKAMHSHSTGSIKLP
ncbi:stAR-related lipid transfer protein 5 isoform X2 [Aythya fuligula]|uniref:StAR-related lipid transfer protein 5 isoform X2 n=1 Tax=Aythya fuligula TaxID=219594 RepID=A0A6J3DM27_AYTFU|nr:stAR-related lipid transfer protein 5 isoform X2 [Aythya fuligula]